MNYLGRSYDNKRLQAIAGRFQVLQAARMAWFQEPAGTSGQSPTVVLLAEFHGERVDDVRTLRADLSGALNELGTPAEVEIVHSGWLPIGGDGQVVLSEISVRHSAALEAKKRTIIEDGSFSSLPDSSKDSFRYFGNFSKIRTPCEITYPNNITVGNWVSFGRYGKIVMLPEKVFGGSCGDCATQHYPKLANTFNFTDWEKGRPADLYIGDGTTIGDRYFIICTQAIEFGKHVMAASDLFVSDCHHIFEEVELPPALLPPPNGDPVSIGDHVWIGIRCSILEGVTIGRHAVVAAHSVVKDDVPPYNLVAGTPAKTRRCFAPISNTNLQ